MVCITCVRIVYVLDNGPRKRSYMWSCAVLKSPARAEEFWGENTPLTHLSPLPHKAYGDITLTVKPILLRLFS